MGANNLTSVQIHLTNACNLRCKHCYLMAGDNSHHSELTLDEWVSSVERFPDTVNEIDLTGGEPLLLPWLFDFAIHLKEKGFLLSLFTNGTLITPDNSERIGNLFSEVFVSIDGTEKLHDDFRGCQGAFESSIRGIKLLSKTPIKITINLTLTAQSLHCLSDAIIYLSELDIDAIRVSKVMPFGRSHEDFKLTQETFSTLQRQFSMAIDQTKDEVEWDYDVEWHKDVSPDSHVCGAAVDHVSIRPNGDVTACSTLADEKFVAGNLKINSLKSIWENPQSEGFNHLRNAKVRDITRHCPQDCPSMEFCSGGCRAVAFYNNESFHRPEEFYCDLLRNGINDKEKLFFLGCSGLGGCTNATN